MLVATPSSACAHIKWFVNVTLLLSQQPTGRPSTQHFAIADLLPLEPIEDYGGARYRHKLRCASRNATPQFVPNTPYAMYPVGLEELKRKLVWCPFEKVEVHGVDTPRHWLFTQYFHRTSYVDAESAAEF